MSNQGTSKNIVYIDYSNSAIDSGNTLDTAKPDTAANLIKNSVIVFEEKFDSESGQEKPDNETTS